ncbi:MAG: hypothetical protein FWG35_00115, partial [Spirochaetaceae bacterium]|nr:hypothetical protein [Spirochaetaceae bacterium]
MVTSTAKKWFVLMAAAIVIAFSGCSDGGGGDGGYTGWGWRPSVTDFNDVLDDQGISRPANYNTLLLLPGTAAKIQAVVWSLVVL